MALNNTQTVLATASTGQIKACLFNLVVYAQEGKRAAYLKDLEKSILEKFPCRIIFIQAQANDPKMLEVSHNEQKENRKFNCEELVIRAGSEMLSKVPFMVIPQLVPDLPIYLLWGQDPTSDQEILPQLKHYATKLIFDSECSINLQSFAKEMLIFMKKLDTEVMDLNWAAISGWRDALATVFDNEELINSLKKSTSINIVYNNQGTEYLRSHETKAIYLQTWLASRLNWKFQSSKLEGNRRISRYKNGGGELVVTLIPEKEEALPAGSIMSFEATYDGCEFQILRKQAQSKVLVHQTQNDRCELPYAVSMPDIKHRSTFMREIFYQAVNGHYRGMLEMIAQSQWEYT